MGAFLQGIATGQAAWRDSSYKRCEKSDRKIWPQLHSSRPQKQQKQAPDKHQGHREQAYADIGSEMGTPLRQAIAC